MNTKMNKIPTPEARALTDDLSAMIQASPTAWHAVAFWVERLEAHGFKRFNPGKHTKLEAGDRIYTTVNDSALYAFIIGQQPLDHGFRLIGSHTDSPALKVKPKHLRRQEGVVTLNTEIYGGPIMHSFFDSPLGLAGRVWVATDDPLAPEMHLVNPEALRIILPSLAIHMNRKVNEGVKIEPQKVMLPVLGLDAPVETKQDTDEDADIPPSDDLLEAYLRHVLKLPRDREILSFDLMTYDAVPPAYTGLHEEFFNASRLDNLAMMHASFSALLEAAEASESKPIKGIVGALAPDNEEVGSRTPQGAGSLYLRDLLTALTVAAGGRVIDLSSLLADSFMISADQAHALHPNYSEMFDRENHPAIGGGPVIKHASGAYATTSESAAVFRQLCRKAGVPCQDFLNRTDLRGGSTIGPITSVNIPMPTVDVGNAIWGMHSLRETASVQDHLAMKQVMATFYTL